MTTEQRDIDGLVMDSGRFYVVPDLQKRLAPHDSFLVIRQGDGTLENDTLELGVFWDLKYATILKNLLEWFTTGIPEDSPVFGILNLKPMPSAASA